MRERIDILLVAKRLVDSRTKAQWLIKNGYVLVENKKILRPGKRIENSLKIKLIKEFPYVGRGGLKLESALKEFSISVKGKICADIGASVGGFTDCLIKHGASKIYAIDIGTDLLHPSLRSEKIKGKLIPMMGLDARNLVFLEEKLDICTIDVTFASLKAILPNIKKLLKDNGNIIALIKPIFEMEFYNDKKFKSILNRNQIIHILHDLLQWNLKNQIFPYKVIKSPILGKEGAEEFLIHLKLKKFRGNLDYNKMIKEIWE